MAFSFGFILYLFNDNISQLINHTTKTNFFFFCASIFALTHIFGKR